MHLSFSSDPFSWFKWRFSFLAEGATLVFQCFKNQLHFFLLFCFFFATLRSFLDVFQGHCFWFLFVLPALSRPESVSWSHWSWAVTLQICSLWFIYGSVPCSIMGKPRGRPPTHSILTNLFLFPFTVQQDKCAAVGCFVFFLFWHEWFDSSCKDHSTCQENAVK